MLELQLAPQGKIPNATSPIPQLGLAAGEAALTDFDILLQGLTQEIAAPSALQVETLPEAAPETPLAAALDALGVEPLTHSEKSLPDGKLTTKEGHKKEGHKEEPASLPETFPPFWFLPMGNPSDTAPFPCPKNPEAPVEAPETPLQAAASPPPSGGPPKPLLNLKDFDVRKFEFKTEIEIPVAPAPKLVRLSMGPDVSSQDSGQSAESDDQTPDMPLPHGEVFDVAPENNAPLAGPEQVERVRVVIEPPPPPPVARQVSMEIGDAESQVRVVIRERNGELSLHFGTANDRLRENLQADAPALLEQLRREAPRAVSLDFTAYGSATDSERESPHERQPKKPLKSQAVFADVDETAYLDEPPSILKPL